MDKYHAFELGLAFGKGMQLNNQTARESMATDEEAWITVKPHNNLAKVNQSRKKPCEISGLFYFSFRNLHKKFLKITEKVLLF